MAHSFLELLRSYFVKSPATEEQQLMSFVIRDLSRSRYRKWYRLRPQELEGVVGDFFYSFYQICSQTAANVQNAAESEQLKLITVESRMTDEGLLLKEQLSVSIIEDRAKTLTLDELCEQVEHNITRFNALFDAAFIESTDRYYNLIMDFVQFVTFDFFSLLKSFEPALPEGDFVFQPKFRRIKINRIIEELKDFLEIAYPLEENQDWTTVMNIVKQYRNGVETISTEQWSALLIQLHQVLDTGIFLLLIRHADQNPLWKSSPRYAHEHIADAYRETVVTEAKNALRARTRKRDQEQFSRLMLLLFGAEEIASRLRYYTFEDHEVLLSNGLEGYRYVKEFNYLKAFVLDFFKKDVRELFDIFSLRGQWVKAETNRLFSDAFHNVSNVFEQLLDFDKSLAIEGTLGMKFRATLAKNKGQAALILGNINATARKIVLDITQSLIEEEGQFKQLYDDHVNQGNRFVRNWDALEVADLPLDKRVLSVYKKLMDFVALMQLCIRSADEDSHKN
jgi:hypothetical protein